MANSGNRYGRNRNLWRKTYGYKRRKPNYVQVVDPITSVTFSYDLQTTYRDRDFFLVKSREASSVDSVPSSGSAVENLGDISGNIGWWIADLNYLITQSADSITRWLDISGLNNHLTQSSRFTSTQPDYVSSDPEFNNLPVVSFTGESLSSSNAPDIWGINHPIYNGIANQTGFSLVFVGDNSIVNPDERIFCEFGNSVGGQESSFRLETGDNVFGQNGQMGFRISQSNVDEAWIIADEVASDPNLTSPHVWICSIDGTSGAELNLWEDGRIATGSVSSFPVTASGQFFATGSFWLGDGVNRIGTAFTGEIIEVALYNRALNNTDVNNILTYITGAYPFISVSYV